MKNKISKFTVIFFLLISTSSFLNANVNLNAIKFTFLSWTSGSTKLSYERAFPEIKQTGELCAGLICAGYDKYKNNPLGFTLRYGHKFFIGSYNVEKPFDGFFLRPEIIYSHFSYDKKDDKMKYSVDRIENNMHYLNRIEYSAQEIVRLTSAYWHNDCKLKTEKITELVNEFREEYDKRYKTKEVK